MLQTDLEYRYRINISIESTSRESFIRFKDIRPLSGIVLDGENGRKGSGFYIPTFLH